MEGRTDCVFVLDRQWRLVFMNTRATSELRAGAALIGESLWDALPHLAGSTFENHY